MPAGRPTMLEAVVVVSVLALATGVGAQPPCLDFAATVLPGGGTTVEVAGPTWILLDARVDEVYRLTIDGAVGTPYELWVLYVDDARVCHVADERTHDGELIGGPLSFDWTALDVTQTGLWLEPPAGEPAEVSIRLEEVAAPPEESVLVIPAVAHIRGVGGTLFRTDVVLFNPLGVPVTARLVLVPEAGEEAASAEVELAAWEVITLEDVVGSLLGLADAKGALRIEVPANRGVHAVSRTYAEGQDGSYGQLIPAYDWNLAAGGRGGDTRTLLLAEDGERFRTNLGFVEVLGLDAELSIELRSAQGDPLVVGRELVLPAFSHLQLGDVFLDPDLPSPDSFSLLVRVLNQARVFVYGSVVDNLSSDPTYLPGLVEDWWLYSPPDARPGLVIPAAAATAGRFGTSWHTDLRVQPVAAGTASVDVEFHPADGGEPMARSFPLAGLETLAVDDVVAELGGEGTGTLWLRPSGGDILATSRTYTADANGSYGQSIAADGGIDGFLERGMVLGLEGSARYRSNLGIANPWSYPVGVELRLYSSAGDELGRRTLEVPASGRRQVNDVFRFFGLDGGHSCRLEFEVVQAPGGQNLFVHGSVIDNRSGDPSTLPAMRIP